MTPLDFIRYVDNQKNNLAKEIEIGPIRYSVTYQPSAYSIIKQIGLERLTKSNFDSIQEKRKNYIQVSLKLFSKDFPENPLFRVLTKNNQEYFDLCNYFSKAADDFTFRYQGKDIKPSIYYFNPNQGLTAYEEILLGTSEISISSTNNSDTLKVYYEDKVFKHGPAIFSFLTKDINHLPDIKF